MFVSISLVNPGFPEGWYNLPISNRTGLTLTIHIVSPDANFCCCYYQKWNQVKLLVFSSWQKMMVGKWGMVVACVHFFPPVAPSWDFVAAIAWFKWVCFERDVKDIFLHTPKNNWHTAQGEKKAAFLSGTTYSQPGSWYPGVPTDPISGLGSASWRP